MTTPRPEYPRPQFVREKWQNLNGEWRFEFDENNQGFKEHWYISHDFTKQITVPFVHQSKLSGLEDVRECETVWYERYFELDYSLEDPQISEVLLHFGGVDYYSYVYVNEVLIGSHSGGCTPFSFNITENLRDGKNKLTVCAIDYPHDPTLTRGKQDINSKMSGIFYEKLTGIWQTVWLEYVPEYYILPEKTFIRTDNATGGITVDTNTNKFDPKCIVELEILENGTKINPECFFFNISHNQQDYVDTMTLKTEIDPKQVKKWDICTPNLYNANLLIRDGNSDDEEIIDKLSFYFGFRDININSNHIFLNKDEYYMKSLLYQGYWPDGLWTAPSDELIKKEIELTIEMGFNHLRLHQLFADPRLLYWADQLGLTLWGEASNARVYDPSAQENLIHEWMAAVYRDRNHPSIVGWVPVNESWGLSDLINSEAQRDFLRTLYYLTKNMDPTRPVVDNDGWEHVKTDIITVHLYRDPEKLIDLPVYAPPQGDPLEIINKISHKSVLVGDTVYENQPIIITEWGGWSHIKDRKGEKSDRSEGWGYGGVIYDDFNDILQKYENYLKELSKRTTWIKGHCYTEFCDQYQEINGMLTFDRQPKCDLSKLRKINDSLP